MGLRRNLVGVMVLTLALAACGGDSDDAGVAVDEIAAAPEPESGLETSPAVAKSGRVEMEVGRAEVGEAAQAVVDLATSPKVGGFLTSSVVDLGDGYGAAAILVHVPNEHFEQTVAGLGSIGEVTRQEMAGEPAAEPTASPRGGPRQPSAPPTRRSTSRSPGGSPLPLRKRARSTRPSRRRRACRSP